VDEPRAVGCSEETQEFSSELSFQFSAFVATTAEDVAKLGQVMAERYNELIVEYCDPQTRRDISLKVLSFSRVSNPGRQLQPGCLDYKALFKVTVPWLRK
jgi:hypothetical protein